MGDISDGKWQVSQSRRFPLDTFNLFFFFFFLALRKEEEEMEEMEEMEEEEEEEAPRRTWNGAANASFSRHSLRRNNAIIRVSKFIIFKKKNFVEAVVTKLMQPLNSFNQLYSIS